MLKKLLRGVLGNDKLSVIQRWQMLSVRLQNQTVFPYKCRKLLNIADGWCVAVEEDWSKLPGVNQTPQWTENDCVHPHWWQMLSVSRKHPAEAVIGRCWEYLSCHCACSLLMYSRCNLCCVKFHRLSVTSSKVLQLQVFPTAARNCFLINLQLVWSPELRQHWA